MKALTQMRHLVITRVPACLPPTRSRPISCKAPFCANTGQNRTVMSHSGEDMLLSGHAFTELSYPACDYDRNMGRSAHRRVPCGVVSKPE